MTGTTSPDGIVYPNDPNAPADVINDMRAQSDSIQTALNTRMTITPTGGVSVIAVASGWANRAGNVPTVFKYGELVICRGYADRSTQVTTTDNGSILVGTIPAGFRPSLFGRWAAAYAQHTSGGALTWTTSSLDINPTNGEMSLVTNQAGQLRVGDWVAFAGLIWPTR